MSMGKNIIIFCFILSVVLWMMGGTTPLTEIMACMQDPSNKLDSSLSNGACTIPVVGGLTVDVSLYSILMFTIVGFVGIAGISLLVGRFPDPYVYFAVVGAFLLAFVTFPVTLMNQSGPYLPEPVKILIGGLFVLSYILSFFEFYKGGSL